MYFWVETTFLPCTKNWEIIIYYTEPSLAQDQKHMITS